MKWAGVSWFLQHTGNFGFSNGALPGTVGAVFVLFLAVVVGFALHRVERVRRIRHAPASLAAALFCAGMVWLALT